MMSGADSALRDVIRESMRDLLETGGVIFGQNLTDVGWVANTIPPIEHPGYCELPISEVGGVGISVGSALADRPTVFISRYHGYLWLNLAPIATYVAPSGSAFRIQRFPFMLRAIADNGALGPIAGGSWLSLLNQVPDVWLVAPVYPKDWMFIWRKWVAERRPIIVAEHRQTYDFCDPEPCSTDHKSLPVLSISGAALLMPELERLMEMKDLPVQTYRQLSIRPLVFEEEFVEHVSKRGKAVVVDPGRTDLGLSQIVAFELERRTGAKVLALGLQHGWQGYAPELVTDLQTAEVARDEIHAWLSE